MTSSMGIRQVAQQVIFGRRAMLICLEELEWNIRKRYANKIPTARNRFRIFVRKHIELLKARDFLFDDYIKLVELLELTDEPDTKYIIQVNW